MKPTLTKSLLPMKIFEFIKPGGKPFLGVISPLKAGSEISYFRNDWS